MKKVIVLCTGNSCRSQMAEGFLRALGGDDIEAHSAGLYPVGLNPRAVAVMNEIGIDISSQQSEAIDPDFLNSMDVVLTVCGNAEKACPVTPSWVKRLHIPVDDPVGTIGDEREIMDAFRRTRDQILRVLKELGFIK
jgi:arsenate reductase